MSIIDDKVKDLLIEFNENLAKTLDNKGITATGTARDTLTVEMDERNQVGQSIGKYYLEFLDRGRGAGRFPPPDNINAWIRVKLGIQEDKVVRQVSFLIGRKLATEGSEIYKNPGQGIELDVLATEFIKRLKSELPRVIKEHVLLGLRSEMKKHLKL